MTDTVYVVASWSLGSRKLHQTDDCPAIRHKNTRAVDADTFPTAEECERCFGGSDERYTDQDRSLNTALDELDGTAIPRGELADRLAEEL